MNEMRKLMEAVESAQGDTPVTESEMQTYHVKYTVTVDVPVKAEDEEQAEEKFFDYLFENELQMDHNFGLDLGEVTITPMDLGEASETDGTDDPHRHFSRNDLIQKVIQQILDDVGNNDFTAIAELLEFIPDDKLAGFLPDY